jgi:hypothetical protein
MYLMGIPDIKKMKSTPRPPTLLRLPVSLHMEEAPRIARRGAGLPPPSTVAPTVSPAVALWLSPLA